MVDDAFGYWLAGLIDGEGSFNIRRNTRGYAPSLHLTLRCDDLPLLVEIQQTLGLGAIEPRKKVNKGGNPCSRWAIQTKSDCLRIVALFDRFPLRSKKARDYALWREAVLEWAKIRGRGHGKADWSRILAIKHAMEDGRRFVPTGVPAPAPDPQLRIEVTS